MLGSGVSKDILAQYVCQLLEVEEGKRRSQPNPAVPTVGHWSNSAMASRANTDVSSSTTYGTGSLDGASSVGGYLPDSPENSDHSGSEANHCAQFQGTPPGLESFCSDSRAVPVSNLLTQQSHLSNASQELQHATGVLQAALANWEVALQREGDGSFAPASLSLETVHGVDPMSVPWPSSFSSPPSSMGPALGNSSSNMNNQEMTRLQKAIGGLTNALREESLGVGRLPTEREATSVPNVKAVNSLRRHVEKQQKESAMKVKRLLEEHQQQLAAKSLNSALAAVAADVIAKQQLSPSSWNQSVGGANLQQQIETFGHPSYDGAVDMNNSFGLGGATDFGSLHGSGLAAGMGVGSASVLGNAIGLGNAVGFGSPAPAIQSDFGGALVDAGPSGWSQVMGGYPMLSEIEMQAALWNAQQQAQQQAQLHTQQQVINFRQARVQPRKGAAAPKAVPKASAKAPPKPQSGEEETLRVHLQALQEVEPDRVVLVRKINRLGFGSPTVLENHYSRYGRVERVLVAHSHVKSQNRRAAVRLRPSGLGFVVMSKKEQADNILRDGPEQVVAGSLIRVQSFKRCCDENQVGDEDFLIEEDGEADAAKAEGDVVCEQRPATGFEPRASARNHGEAADGDVVCEQRAATGFEPRAAAWNYQR